MKEMTPLEEALATIEKLKAQVEQLQPTPEVKVWEPKGGLYYVSIVQNAVLKSSSTPKSRKAGIEYPTEAHARKAIKAIRAYSRQMAWLAENDDGWVADWNDAQQIKYFIYNVEDNIHMTTGGSSFIRTSIVYMSEENANKLAALMNKGIVRFEED